MRTTAARIGLVVAVPVLIIAGFGAAARPTSSITDIYAVEGGCSSAGGHPIVPQIDPAPAPQDPLDRDDPDAAVDIYGNEVTDAVAKYKADRAGTLYELHSPQTEVPRLASPKS